MSINITTAKNFHGHLYTELAYWPGRAVETKETKHFIIQEREISYRCYPHFHPYVGQLLQRLLGRDLQQRGPQRRRVVEVELAGEVNDHCAVPTLDLRHGVLAESG